MLDLLLLAVLGLVTWCVASEGPWGAAMLMFSVLFGGFIAMNFFEPIAEALTSGGPYDAYWDFLSLAGLFAVSVTAFRLAIDQIMPLDIPVAAIVFDVGRWVFGLVTGYITMAFVAAAIHTAPIPLETLGFSPNLNQRMLFGIGPDFQWLGYTQYVTEKIYKSGRIFDGEQYALIPENARSKTTVDDRRREMETFSSFPMRYAARRKQHLSGVMPSGGPAAAPGPVVPPTPVPGGGGSRPAF